MYTRSLMPQRLYMDLLKKKFPNIIGPHAQDICYATENRQTAVKNVAHGADLVLVVGSRNSSNSNRLVEVSQNLGTNSYLIDKAKGHPLYAHITLQKGERSELANLATELL